MAALNPNLTPAMAEINRSKESDVQMTQQLDNTSDRILIIADSYMSSDVFETAFAQVEIGVPVDVVTIDPSRKAGPEAGTLREYEGSPDQVADFIQGHTILLVHGAPVTRQVLEQNPSVRFLGVARGGPVNVDVAAARELGVTVTTTPGKNAQGVADLTIGFLIQLWRNTVPSHEHVRHAAAAGEALSESAFEGAAWFGREISGRRLGLLGMGNVAQRVAAHANALGMDVIAYDPFVTVDIPGVTMVESFDEMLGSLDALSIHARATAENRRMINGDVFSSLPAGAAFVNTARESLVDEHELLKAVQSGHLSGVAMDVFEPDGPWRELAAHPRVIITPHIAGATHQTLARGAQMLRDDLGRFLRGEELRWAVQ